MRTAMLILPLLSQLLVLSNAQAQERGLWITTLSVNRKALAVGECSAVALDLKGAKGESPRGPNGQLISMSDFDLSVSAPAERAAVGKYDGANSFAVCACPKAPAGTVATVTAAYPSKWIAQKVRVPGVSFTTTTSVPIVAGASSGNPPGCDASGASTSGAWMVTVQPSVSMLPIGGCSAVSLTIRDSTGKDTPRGPSGNRVSLADFDMSATSANGVDVVGKYDGASAFSACACQSGTVGEAATITAEYPAQQLDAKLRVAGVEMQASAPVTLAAARGASNPPGCGLQQLAVARGTPRLPPAQATAGGAAAGGAAAGGAGAGSAPGAAASAHAGEGGAADGAAAGAGASAAGGGAGGAAKSGKRKNPSDSPAASAPTIRDAPPTLKGPIAVAPGAGKGVLAPPAGAAPTGVVVSASPRIARLSWNTVPNVARYAVWRGDGASVSIERTPAAFTATQFADTVPDAHAAYHYAVIAYYADGRQGESPAVQYTSPPMVNPAGFTAAPAGVVGGGGMTFQWQPVPGAQRYRLDGPGLPATGYFVVGTSAGHPHMPGGPGEWRLQTIYPGNIGDSASAATASLVMHVLPNRTRAWLTKNNGAGSLAQVQVPLHSEVNNSMGGHPIGNWTGDLLPTYDATYAEFLTKRFRWNGNGDFLQSTESDVVCTAPLRANHTCQTFGLMSWLNSFGWTRWDDSNQSFNEVRYGNPTDLGVGRRAFCEQHTEDGSTQRGFGVPFTPGIYTMCYATAHGVTPGHPGFNDPQAIANPAPGIGADFILAMIIKKDPNGTVFLAIGKDGKLLPSVGLDTEGQKFVPFVCIACHGGTYNTTTRKIDGSSFLPLDPNLLSFASANDKASSEEKIRVINLMIHNAQPQTAIAQYLNGLYNGQIGTAGATAVVDYVPASWAPQATFYKSVVRANCTMCHLAAPDSWNFASWQNFQGNAGLIYADVCLQHTMPQAEVPFKNFWLKDSGILYLPGLLAATLGKSSC